MIEGPAGFPGGWFGLLYQQAPVLAELFPFLGALVVAVAGLYRAGSTFPVAVAALSASLLSSLAVLVRVLAEGRLQYRLGGWPAPIGIEYVIDALNALVLPLIPGVALAAALYSRSLVGEQYAGKLPQFYGLYLLHVAGLMGMTVTGDAFNLYVLVEITALSSYALLALGRPRALLSTFNYVMLGTIGASFYLLGVGYLYIKTGTLNMLDLADRLPPLYDSPAVGMGFLLMMAGLWMKMAFFPLHGWLPGAYADASAPAYCLIAPLVTKVTVYVMIRVLFTVFSVRFLSAYVDWGVLVPYLAAAAVIAGSVLALAQDDFRRMLTYVIVAEIGYMVGGAWLGNAAGLTGAVFHIAVDAVMTLGLFMVAGILARRGIETIEGFRGLFRTMPATMAAFTAAGLSLIGIPPTGGFFSKWYLLSGAIEAQNWAFLVSLLFSSLVNAFLVFRIIEKAFLEPFEESVEGDGGERKAHHHLKPEIREAPAGMLVPLWLAAAGVFALGIFSGTIIESLVVHALPAGLF